MPDWRRGRVVLVGDSVDSPQGVSAALEAFEQRWRPVVQMAPRGQYAASTKAALVKKPMDPYRLTPQF